MKVRKSLFILSCALILSSCASNQTSGSQNTTEAPAANTEKTVSPAQKFIMSMDEVNLKMTSSPKDTEIGKAFASPFTVLVTDNSGAPMANYSVTFSYPDTKKDKDIVFTTQTATTDASGKASISLPAPSIAADDFVTVYPTPISKSEKVVSAAKSKAVKAIWKVKSNMVKSGILLYVWEYDAKGKPANNFYNILGDLQTNGAKKVGNAPLSDTSYLNESAERQAAVNKSIVGDDFKYLIGGTLKYITPTGKVDNVYSCKMVADIYAIDLSTGKEIYRKSFEGTGFGDKWGKDVTDCKNKLSRRIVSDILYSF